MLFQHSVRQELQKQSEGVGEIRRPTPKSTPHILIPQGVSQQLFYLHRHYFITNSLINAFIYMYFSNVAPCKKNSFVNLIQKNNFSVFLLSQT